MEEQEKVQLYIVKESLEHISVCGAENLVRLANAIQALDRLINRKEE